MRRRRAVDANDARLLAHRTPSERPDDTHHAQRDHRVALTSALPARCTRNHLDLSLGRVSPGAGNRYAPIIFTNTGTEPCSLHGCPGVTLLDTAGDRIGEPAERQGLDAQAVILDAGGSAYAALHTVAEGVTDKPCWRRAGPGVLAGIDLGAAGTGELVPGVW